MINRKAINLVLFMVLLLNSWISWAELEQGATAPDVQLEAALAGESFTFSLSEALTKGPVVLFFYPKAFTQGCSIEAKMFADAMDDFKKHNATVVGISNDDIKVLQDFSLKECAGKFAVAADPNGDVIRAYDAQFFGVGSMATRVSYVISPDQKIIFAHKAMDPQQHATKTLQAVRQWHGTSGAASSQ